jgi:hypothetical protein
MYSSSDDTETIYKTYEEWEENPFGRHISKYYNLRLRKYVYLNGRQRAQNVLVPYMTDPIPLGICNTDFPFLIAGRIEQIRATKVFYYWDAILLSKNKCHTLLYFTCFFFYANSEHSFRDSGNTSFHVLHACTPRHLTWFDTWHDVTKPHGVSLGAAATEDGHVSSLRLPAHYQRVRCHSPQFWGLRHFHVLPAWSITSSDQSQLHLFRPITALLIRPITGRVSSDVTPQHATRRLSASTVVTAEGHATIFIFPPKISAKYKYQHTRCHRPQNYFSKFRVFAPFWGPTASLFWGLWHLPTLLTSSHTSTSFLCFDLFLLPSSW